MFHKLIVLLLTMMWVHLDTTEGWMVASMSLQFFLLQLKSTVQLLGEKMDDTQMVIHYETSTKDLILYW